MRLPKLREIGEALKSFFSPPYTNDFPFKPIHLPEGFRGKPQFYEEDCVGCLACFEVCPARAIDYVDDLEQKCRVLTHHPGICIFCQQCERACITGKGIKLTREFDLAEFTRRKGSQAVKELLICDHCRGILAPLDQVKYLAGKVGNLAYANPTLLLAAMKELKLPLGLPPTRSVHGRSGHLKFLCPHCRREVITKEQW
jgi:hydrogenase-4 component H